MWCNTAVAAPPQPRAIYTIPAHVDFLAIFAAEPFLLLLVLLFLQRGGLFLYSHFSLIARNSPFVFFNASQPKIEIQIAFHDVQIFFDLLSRHAFLVYALQVLTGQRVSFASFLFRHPPLGPGYWYVAEFGDGTGYELYVKKLPSP